MISFARGSVFALACWTYIPLFVFFSGAVIGQVKKAMIGKMGMIGQLGGHTSEILGAIKLIFSFAQEDIAIASYDEMARKTMQKSKIAVIKQGVVGGMLFTLTMGYLIFCLSLASVFLEYAPTNYFTMERYDVAELMTASACSVFACQSIGIVAPIFPTIMQGLISAKSVYDVIERQPMIKSKKGAIETVSAAKMIKFNNISFRYPTQVEGTRDILSNASFHI